METLRRAQRCWQGSKHYGRAHDIILFYNGGDENYTWNQLFIALDPDYVEETYRSIDEENRQEIYDNAIDRTGRRSKRQSGL
ncbi:MAG: hypothetical protein WDM76_03410 [Limisphaerales bacterium]